MRQQLRLRVLAPVAVLALLGAGVGAFAYGKPPADNASFVTTHEDKTLKPKGAVSAALWVKGANALCRDAAEQIRSVGRVQDPESAAALLVRNADVAAGLGRALDRLGSPKGKKADARALGANARASASLLRRSIGLLRKGDVTTAVSLLQKRAPELGAEGAALARRLGVSACAKFDLEPDAYRADVRRSATNRLDAALAVSPAVVIVLYQPASGVDNAAVREARAGALLAHAGFVAVNVKRNSAVTKFFRRYDVRQAPAVMVFLRGPRLISHFDGFADRVTVAQAVSDALR